MKDIFEEVDNSERVSRAKERAEQLKARYLEEVRAASKKHRKLENHHKYMMGGIVAKYFPECYKFEEEELDKILKAAMDTQDFNRKVEEVKRSAGNGAISRPYMSNRAEGENEGKDSANAQG